jgi:hypothetical protein
VQILFTAFASEGNFQESRQTLFFLLASSLVFEMPILGGSTKGLWYNTYFLVPVAWCFFFRKNIFSSSEDFRVL